MTSKDLKNLRTLKGSVNRDYLNGLIVPVFILFFVILNPVDIFLSMLILNMTHFIYFLMQLFL